MVLAFDTRSERSGMYVRVTTVKGLGPLDDDAMTTIRDVCESVWPMDGLEGLTISVDRSDGSMVVVTWWDSEERRAASQARRDGAVHALEVLISGDAVGVTTWEGEVAIFLPPSETALTGLSR